MRNVLTITILAIVLPIIIISCPKATLGKEFNIVKKGSMILAKNLYIYKIKAIIKANRIPRKKLINTSSKVILI